MVEAAEPVQMVSSPLMAPAENDELFPVLSIVYIQLVRAPVITSLKNKVHRPAGTALLLLEIP